MMDNKKATVTVAAFAISTDVETGKRMWFRTGLKGLEGSTRQEALVLPAIEYREGTKVMLYEPCEFQGIRVERIEMEIDPDDDVAMWKLQSPDGDYWLEELQMLAEHFDSKSTLTITEPVAN